MDATGQRWSNAPTPHTHRLIRSFLHTAIFGFSASSRIKRTKETRRATSTKNNARTRHDGHDNERSEGTRNADRRNDPDEEEGRRATELGLAPARERGEVFRGFLDAITSGFPDDESGFSGICYTQHPQRWQVEPPITCGGGRREGANKKRVGAQVLRQCELRTEHVYGGDFGRQRARRRGFAPMRR